MRSFMLGVLLVLVGFGSSRPFAHHSVSGEFDMSKTVTLKSHFWIDWIACTSIRFSRRTLRTGRTPGGSRLFHRLRCGDRG